MPATTLAPSPQAQHLMARAFSSNTARAYAATLAALQHWLQGRPLTDALLADYIAARHQAGLAPASLALITAAVRALYRLQGEDAPVGPLTQRTLRGARRDGRTRGRGQPPGLGFSDADTVAQIAAQGGTVRDLRNAALVAVMSDALLRVSEAAALQVTDFTPEPDGSARLTIRHSKTDPDGTGAILYLGGRTADRVRAYLDAAGVTAGALFRRIRRGGHVTPAGLSSVGARKVLKACAAAAGFTASSHSFRVGSAQSLAAAGATLVELQHAGRWQSPQMPAHYSRAQRAASGAVARLRYGQ